MDKHTTIEDRDFIEKSNALLVKQLDERFQKKLDDLVKLFPFIKAYCTVGLGGYILTRVDSIAFEKVKLLRKYSILRRLDNNIYTLSMGDIESLVLDITYIEDDTRPVFSKEDLYYLEELYEDTLGGPVYLGKSEFRELYEKISTHRLPTELNQKLFSHIIGEYMLYMMEMMEEEERHET